VNSAWCLNIFSDSLINIGVKPHFLGENKGKSVITYSESDIQSNKVTGSLLIKADIRKLIFKKQIIAFIS